MPQYDRVSDVQLAFSARSRPADTLLAADELAAAPGEAGRALKKLRASRYS